MENLQSLSDELLVKSYEQGCNKAFEVLLTRHKDRLYNYIFGITHDSDLADDVFQDTFIKAITTIRQHRYTEVGRFFPWLTRIAHNIVYDNYRREKNENTISTDENETIDLLNNAKLYDDTFDSLTYESALVNMMKLIDLLPENQQRIVRMRFVNDMSFKEIAKIEEISINTALGRMRYAVLNLRKLAHERHLVACFEKAF
jgi:RNA polymerase sigma factor (sigma-70 family)